MRAGADIEAELQVIWRRDAFWRSSLHVGLPLAIWAGHFFACYVFVAVGCRAGLDGRSIMGSSLLTLGLAALTVLALAWLAFIVARAASGARSCATMTVVRFGMAVLCLVAVGLTSVPILLLSSCLQ